MIHHRFYHLSSREIQDLIELDILFRVNAANSPKYIFLTQHLKSLLDSIPNSLYFQDLIHIDKFNSWQLTKIGLHRLKLYAELYQKFHVYSIFKCVNLNFLTSTKKSISKIHFGEDPLSSKQNNNWFDLRIAIFENYAFREGQNAPLHILAYFITLEKLKTSSFTAEKDWITDLIEGKFIEGIAKYVDAQVSIESICPPLNDPEELCDKITNAGFTEIAKRYFEKNLLDDEHIQKEIDDFWCSHIPTDTCIISPIYYEQFYNSYSDISMSSLIVNTFI